MTQRGQCAQSEGDKEVLVIGVGVELALVELLGKFFGQSGLTDTGLTEK